MRSLAKIGLICVALSTAVGCSHQDRLQYPTTASPLGLAKVVLYRNGVGYFERQGEIDGDLLRLKVRKDQVNDLLKSLTIVDRRTGRAVSVSMPLDPETWANAALSTLSPGQGSLAQVLDMLRGAEVELDTTEGSLHGRIVMVEYLEDEPDPARPSPTAGREGSTVHGRDHKVTLMAGKDLKVVRLSKVKEVTVKDGDLAMQFHRRLDATAGEGMFQQVEIAIRLDTPNTHDLVVSYVVEAPMWKPTYRVVLPEGGKGEALLQAWAVVDNTSGEDWRDVKLSLTAGAPIAFQYDLHTPRRVPREDLSHSVHRRRARVAMGETTFEESPAEPEAEYEESGADYDDAAFANMPVGGAGMMPGAPPPPAAQPARKPTSSARSVAAREKKDKGAYGPMDRLQDEKTEDQDRTISLESLRQSTLAQAKASQASGLTRFDIQHHVTVPDGNSTMVAIVNQPVKGEEAFLYDPRGGGGQGYEQNPFRVVRFRNTTPFVLEPGPISIYAGGSFVGEGISETVGAGTSATIPFAVEPGIMVTRESESLPEELELVKIARGVLHVERFHRVKSIWKIQAQTMDEGFKVLIRQPRYGASYQLKDRPNDTEDLAGAYLIPVSVPPKKREAKIEVVEQTPTKSTIHIMDERVLPMLERALSAQNLSAGERAQLEPLVAKRREVGKIVNEINAKRRRQGILAEQMNQARDSLRTLEKMKGAEAEQMKRERIVRLEAWSKEHDEIGRQLLVLEEKRELLGVQLDEMLQDFTFR